MILNLMSPRKLFWLFKVRLNIFWANNLYVSGPTPLRFRSTGTASAWCCLDWQRPSPSPGWNTWGIYSGPAKPSTNSSSGPSTDKVITFCTFSNTDVMAATGIHHHRTICNAWWRHKYLPALFLNGLIVIIDRSLFRYNYLGIKFLTEVCRKKITGFGSESLICLVNSVNRCLGSF